MIGAMNESTKEVLAILAGGVLVLLAALFAACATPADRAHDVLAEARQCCQGDPQVREAADKLAEYLQGVHANGEPGCSLGEIAGCRPANAWELGAAIRGVQGAMAATKRTGD